MPLSRFELQQVNFHNVLDMCNTKRRGIKAGIDRCVAKRRGVLASVAKLQAVADAGLASVGFAKGCR